MVLVGSFSRYVMAVERVEELLRKVTKALNAAEVPYAIVGGNAVAAWVATVDEGAVRATKDVDILLRRDDLARVAEVMHPLGLVPVEVLGVQMFVDERHPSPKTGVHVVFARERIRPHYAHTAPDATQSVRQGDTSVIDLGALVEMKLQSYRYIDRAHLQDLMAVGLITEEIKAALPPDLRERLQAIVDSAGQESGPG
jgi:hypothetical protein